MQSKGVMHETNDEWFISSSIFKRNGKILFETIQIMYCKNCIAKLESVFVRTCILKRTVKILFHTNKIIHCINCIAKRERIFEKTYLPHGPIKTKITIEGGLSCHNLKRNAKKYNNKICLNKKA